jgi:2-aminomuconate deaminase
MSPDDAFILGSEKAQALAHYPHARRVGDLLFISGTSSRRADNTHVGATANADGSFTLDIEAQTEAVIENIRGILKAAGLDLEHLVDVTTFLVEMKDFPGYNRVYNRFFDAPTGPTRTTVAVHQLPHPNLLIEIKAMAAFPAGR